MKVTVQFKDDNGEGITAVFDEATSTVVTDKGQKSTYKSDLASNSMEIKGKEFNGTVSFDGEPNLTVGASSRYKTSDGRVGISTILAVE